MRVFDIVRRVDPGQLGLIACEVIFLAGFYLLIRGRSSPLFRILQFVLLVLCLRVLMFSTPLTWGGWFLVLQQPDIDWRERDVIANKIKRYFEPRRAHPFVVVGTSQTWAIYSKFAKTHPALEPYYMAGMAPIDLVEEYARIKTLAPRRIVLFMSEFDLARPVVTTAVPLSTLPLEDYPRFYAALAAATSPAEARDVLVQKAVTDAFPEFTYRFVVTGFVNELQRRLQSSPAAAAPLPNGVQSMSLQGLDARYVPAQMTLVRSFVARATQDGIGVTIVEGQYNPLAYSPKNVAIHRDVIMPALARLAARYPMVRLLPISRTGTFVPEDYNDLYHVKPEPAERFAARVLAALQADG